ncbi:antiviral reverse transcriptase Drt3a [Agrobacterium sp. DE0009]|uniref:antiviral reverse transcriptase Drt3a n=1 Tax=Agrobacterium sp. DE0009 TaxID=2587505 RepID=UPI0011A7412E|nr:antiviral reverse transcriptase Drt3a [Agrobacterium sp. DE0009]
MYDFSFSRESLNREFSREDFRSMPELIDQGARAEIVASAEGYAADGFSRLLLERSNVKGRDLYQHGSLPKELVLRKLSRNLRVITKVRQANRDDIVKSLICLLGEGEDFDVYRIDIKNFYPSLDRAYIDSLLCADSSLPAASYSVWKSFSESLRSQSISGLPPGLSISATLSEYAMRDFDRGVANLPGAYYFARYVDDMVILRFGKPEEVDFLKSVASLLPPGLILHPVKTRKFPFREKAADISEDGSLEFLGYQFSVSKRYKEHNKWMRKVSVDIAKNKISKIKSRIVLSIVDYLNGGSFRDLEDRIRIITGNYHIYDHVKSFRRKVGIYYNYNQITMETSVGLPELDRFLKGMLLSRSGNVCRRLHARLTPDLRRQLLKYSFSSSFQSKTHYHFNSTRLSEIIDCWKYE